MPVVQDHSGPPLLKYVIGVVNAIYINAQRCFAGGAWEHLNHMLKTIDDCTVFIANTYITRGGNEFRNVNSPGCGHLRYSIQVMLLQVLVYLTWRGIGYATSDLHYIFDKPPTETCYVSELKERARFLLEELKSSPGLCYDAYLVHLDIAAIRAPAVRRSDNLVSGVSLCRPVPNRCLLLCPEGVRDPTAPFGPQPYAPAFAAIAAHELLGETSFPPPLPSAPSSPEPEAGQEGSGEQAVEAAAPPGQADGEAAEAAPVLPAAAVVQSALRRPADLPSAPYDDSKDLVFSPRSRQYKRLGQVVRDHTNRVTRRCEQSGRGAPRPASDKASTSGASSWMPVSSQRKRGPASDKGSTSSNAVPEKQMRAPLTPINAPPARQRQDPRKVNHPGYTNSAKPSASSRASFL